MRRETSAAGKLHPNAAHRQLLGLFCGAAAVLLLYRCPFKLLTGLDCPGCGLSRALLCLLHLDFYGALRCHPLSILIYGELLIAAFFQYIVQKPIGKKTMLLGTGVTAVLMLAVWFIKIFQI